MKKAKRKIIFFIFHRSDILALFLGLLSLLYALYSFGFFSNNPKKQKIINAFSFIANSSKNKHRLWDVNPKSIAFFMNYHESYSCPYYSDRVDLIAPEINRLLQFMRTFSSVVIFDTKSQPISVTKSNFSSTLNISQNLFLEESSPLLEDRCLYSEFDIHPRDENYNIHHDILFSTTTDFFITDPKTAIDICIDMNIKYVIIGGMFANKWLIPLLEQFKAANIIPFYLYDLSDVQYYRASQKSKFNTHVDALRHFWSYIIRRGYSTVNHFSLLDHPYPSHPEKSIQYDGNKKAYFFSDFLENDFSE